MYLVNKNTVLQKEFYLDIGQFSMGCGELLMMPQKYQVRSAIPKGLI